MSADCVFCKILDGQIPSMKVYEDDRTLVFMDINPLNAGHCLVVTRPHAPLTITRYVPLSKGLTEPIVKLLAV